VKFFLHCGILFDFSSLILSNNFVEYMKKGILIVLLSALAGGLTAFAVVKGMQSGTHQAEVTADGMQFRTVSLMSA
jgi:hypothetical protein